MRAFTEANLKTLFDGAEKTSKNQRLRLIGRDAHSVNNALEGIARAMAAKFPAAPKYFQFLEVWIKWRSCYGMQARITRGDKGWGKNRESRI